ncbi:MAG: ECF transporter S component [Clostridia bacterium]|nr:ECF transporter S component [Candidatus Pelethousia sp.]NCB30885.1 ECF transporter S component [Clostridia bacterium]
MLNSTPTRRLSTAALCLAMAVLLPQFFHAIPNFGSIFLPMHLPVLLCGFICGWKYGLLCGMFAPVLSFLLAGMPGAMILPGMVCELAVYGLVTGLLFPRMHTQSWIADIYFSLLPAMLLGRVFLGLTNGLVFLAGQYTFQVFLAGAFVTALPGILVQLVLTPALLFALKKANLLQYA